MNKIKKAMYKIGKVTCKYDVMSNKRCLLYYLIFGLGMINVFKNRKVNPDYKGYKELAVIIGAYGATVFSVFCDETYLTNDFEEEE